MKMQCCKYQLLLWVQELKVNIGQNVKFYYYLGVHNSKRKKNKIVHDLVSYMCICVLGMSIENYVQF